MTQQVKNLALFTMLLMVTITSCNFYTKYKNREEDRRDAEKVTNEFYELLKAKDYQATTRLFSNEFFDVTDTDSLFSIFTLTAERLGDLKTTEVEQWETTIVEGTKPSSNYVFIYKNTYDKFPSSETIRLIREEDGQIRIVKYHIDSDGFIDM